MSILNRKNASLTLTLALAACDFGGKPDPSEAGPCTTGTLFAGNPKYDDVFGPGKNNGDLKSDPPLQWRGIAFDGNLLYTNVGEELWYVDLSASPPVQKRLAGQWQTNGAAQFHDGPCVIDARLGITTGIAVLPDHSLVVADIGANALVKIADPTGPNCKMSYFVGTKEVVTPPISVRGEATDGPAATAKITGPKWPVAGADGTIYYVDEGAGSVKKIATDADRTVSNVAALKGSDLDDTNGMVLRGDKLYLVGNDGANGIVLEVSTVDGSKKTIFKGDYKALGDELLPSGITVVPTSIATDGTRLFIGGMGFIWQITDDGKAIHAAGSIRQPSSVDFPPPDYDAFAEHPAKELILGYHLRTSVARADTFLASSGDALYFVGASLGNGYYVEKITCPK